MKKILLVNSDKCTGCETCVDVCSGLKAGVYSERVSRIRVQKNEIKAVFIPLVCEQCREHPCVDICPAKAIQFDETLSIFNVVEDACTGCGRCEEACLYNGIFVSNGVALKCDLCKGDPVCVPACYPKSLQYIDVTKDSIFGDLENKIDKFKKMKNYFND